MNRIMATTSLGSVLERRAAESPDQRAYLHLGGPSGPVECTYAELSRRASAIAARLRETGHPGDRVLLLYPPGLDFIYAFLACVSAGAVAVPAPPPNLLKPERSLARLQSIVESARPTFALTTSGTLAAVRTAVAGNETFARMQWLATDDLPGLPVAGPGEWSPSAADAIALIQYTSGSTADPKGAALSHENLAHNVAYFDEGWDHTPSSILVNWLPAFHDLGLLYGILMPLWGGFLGVQMSPIDVIQRPFLWLQAISNLRATHSAGPNFIYDLCTRKVSDAERSTLDLSSWRMALTAAEPIRKETMTRFADRFAEVGFRYRTFSPGYGLSECTCKVVSVPCSEEATILDLRDDKLEQDLVELAPPGPGTRAVVGCGRPTHGVGITIVDPTACTPRAPGQVGEIWISGPSVAHGYWDQPAATEASLRARLAGGDETPYLRTGDLGFLHEGQLYVTGRVKDLIIVRGSNHYPQDLEYTAQEACPRIRPGCCAAFSYEEGGEERVAVLAEAILGEVAAEEVIAGIRMAISEAHGIKVHRVELLCAGTLPKTTSGKIQRQACKRAMLAGRLSLLS